MHCRLRSGMHAQYSPPLLNTKPSSPTRCRNRLTVSWMSAGRQGCRGGSQKGGYFAVTCMPRCCHLSAFLTGVCGQHVPGYRERPAESCWLPCSATVTGPGILKQWCTAHATPKNGTCFVVWDAFDAHKVHSSRVQQLCQPRGIGISDGSLQPFSHALMDE